jgi:hypothetical protein
MWAARNLKYQAVALARAIRVNPRLNAARDFGVRKPDGAWTRLLDLSLWELLNLDTDDALAMPHRLIREAGMEDAAVQTAIDTYTIQAKGAAEFDARCSTARCGRRPPSSSLRRRIIPG